MYFYPIERMHGERLPRTIISWKEEEKEEEGHHWNHGWKKLKETWWGKGYERKPFGTDMNEERKQKLITGM